MAIVCLSTALLLLNFVAPQVAASAIGDDLGASFTDLQWVLGVFPLAVAVLLLTAGALADRFGRRRLFLIGLGTLCSASLVCALAPSPTALIAARLAQGCGAAIVFPSSLALLAQQFHGSARRRAVGVWGAVIGLAFAAGPLVGGLLVETLGWRSVFACSVVLGLPTIALARRQLAESSDPNPPPLDWAGVATLSAGLFLAFVSVLRGNELGWTSPAVLGGLVGGAIALMLFVVVERATARPMIDLALFRNRTFTGATLVVSLMAAGTFAPVVYVTLFLLEVQGRGPTETGLVLAPLALTSFAIAALAGKANERLPLRGALVAGMLLSAAGTLLLRAALSPAASWTALAAGLALTGAGMGLVNPLATFAHLGVLPPTRGGLASALNNTARQVGLAVGIAALGALLPTPMPIGGMPPGEAAPGGSEGFTDAMDKLLLIATGLNLLAAAAACVLIRQRDLWTPPGLTVEPGVALPPPTPARSSGGARA